MKDLKFAFKRYPLRVIVVMALAAVLLAGMAIVTSLRGWPGYILKYEGDASPNLPGGTKITAWASFNKDSYLTGETAAYQLHVLYRKGEVEPDFSGLKSQISFLPFEQIALHENFKDVGDGTFEYELQYRLQVTEGRRLGHYEFSPAVLHYSEPGANGILQSLRVEQPKVYIASYYPWNVARIGLLGTKGQIAVHVLVRQWLLAFASVGLLALALFALWHFGHRRGRAELSEPERLWREFNEFRNVAMDDRAFLLNCERIFTRIFQRYASMSPEMFWSGAVPVDDVWSETVTKARNALRRNYQFDGPVEADVHDMTLLLGGALSALVEEERLKREEEPSFTARLLQQPRLLTVSGILAGVSALLFLLACKSSIWVSPEIERYNQAVVQMRNGDGIHVADNLYMQLAALGDTGEISKVKAAAYYNAGTLRAKHGFIDFPPPQQQKFIEAIFQAASPEVLLQSILFGGFINLNGQMVNSEVETVSILVNAEEQFRRAELDLKKAALAQTGDEDVLRNLELVVKRKDALLISLAQIRDYLNEKMKKEGDDAPVSDQGVIDLLNAKLPDEYKEDETIKGSRAYMIFERF